MKSFLQHAETKMIPPNGPLFTMADWVPSRATPGGEDHTRLDQPFWPDDAVQLLPRPSIDVSSVRPKCPQRLVHSGALQGSPSMFYP